MTLLAISFVAFAIFGSMLDIELFYIPLAIVGIAFTYFALFYFANKDLIDDLTKNN